MRHAPALTTCHAHLSTILVKLRTEVRTGQALGAVGCTGHCFGPHLHFEVRRGPWPDSGPVDPLPELGRPPGDD